jgi:hypothetical protein
MPYATFYKTISICKNIALYKTTPSLYSWYCLLYQLSHALFLQFNQRLPFLELAYHRAGLLCESPSPDVVRIQVFALPETRMKVKHWPENGPIHFFERRSKAAYFRTPAPECG